MDDGIYAEYGRTGNRMARTVKEGCGPYSEITTDDISEDEEITDLEFALWCVVCACASVTVAMLWWQP